MIPLRLTARNVRSYADLDVTFGEGVLALVGPNGAGKSTIIDLIDTALFADGARELAPMLRLGEIDLVIDLTFEHAGVTYLVSRGYGATGRGKVALELRANGTPLNQETIGATQARLEEILGFTRQTFRASSFCRQGDARAFCDAQPRERKQLLADILRLDLWDRLLAGARHDYNENEIAGAKLEARAEAIEEVLAEREARATAFSEAFDAAEAATDERAAAEIVLDAYREALAAARERYQHRRALEAEAARLADEAHRLAERVLKAEQAREAAERERAELEELEPKAAALAELEKQLEEGRAARQRYAVAETERRGLLIAIEEGRAAARARREHFADLPPDELVRCDRCQQPLTAPARQAALESLNREAAELEEQADRRQERVGTLVIPEAPTDAELTHLTACVLVARSAAGRIGAIRERLSSIGTAIGEGKLAAEQIEKIRPQRVALHAELATLPPVEKPEGDEPALISRVDYLRNFERRAAGALEVARDRLNAVDVAQAQLADIGEDLDRTRERRAMLGLAEVAYGRNGVPALIVESRAIPELEAQANDVLERWAAPYRVELRTQKELKSGGVAEALDIVCLDGGAFERPFETFSGGEKTRIALALRIGLARLLARRRGANSRLLVIDEPEGLDAEGMDRLPALLEALQDEYGLILVVSHQPQLATAFPRALQIVKAGGVSRVNAGFQMVAA